MGLANGSCQFEQGTNIHIKLSTWTSKISINPFLDLCMVLKIYLFWIINIEFILITLLISGWRDRIQAGPAAGFVSGRPETDVSTSRMPVSWIWRPPFPPRWGNGDHPLQLRGYRCGASLPHTCWECPHLRGISGRIIFPIIGVNISINIHSLTLMEQRDICFLWRSVKCNGNCISQYINNCETFTTYTTQFTLICL